MRTIATLAWLCGCTTTHAQLPTCDMLPTEGWVHADALDEEHIHHMARDWVMGAMGTAIDTMGTIIGACVVPITLPSMDGAHVLYTLTITPMDGRMRYACRDFTLRTEASGTEGIHTSTDTPLAQHGSADICMEVREHVRAQLDALDAFVRWAER